jgi:plasmid stabilization system protein ParE
LSARASLTPLAQADIDAALNWYGQLSESAAAGFMAAVEDAL